MYGSDPILAYVATAAVPLRGRLPLPASYHLVLDSPINRAILIVSDGQGRTPQQDFHYRDVITVPFLSMRLVASGLKCPITRMMGM